MDHKRKAMFAALATAFNKMMNIKEGYFGASPAARKPSPANLRAADLVRRRTKAHEDRIAGRPYEAGL